MSQRQQGSRTVLETKVSKFRTSVLKYTIHPHYSYIKCSLVKVTIYLESFCLIISNMPNNLSIFKKCIFLLPSSTPSLKSSHHTYYQVSSMPQITLYLIIFNTGMWFCNMNFKTVQSWPTRMLCCNKWHIRARKKKSFLPK